MLRSCGTAATDHALAPAQQLLEEARRSQRAEHVHTDGLRCVRKRSGPSVAVGCAVRDKVQRSNILIYVAK